MRKIRNTFYHLRSALRRKKLGEAGLTMIELLIVIVILAILVIVLMWALRGQTNKARDAKRKSNLHTYKNAMEDYYNDNESYPPDGSLTNCDSADLAPYMKMILCDPGIASDPYDYIVDVDGNWYGICAILENKTDPAIAKSGCSGGCGTNSDFNYCILSGTDISAVGGSYDVGGGGGGDEGEGTDVGDFACFVGVCNAYDKEVYTCEYTFSDSSCENLCPGGAYDTCVLL